jgi:hypothetical protein
LAADDEPSFEVSNPAIAKNPLWIPDVSQLFQSDADLFDQTDAYDARNPEIDRNLVGKSLQRLLKIVNNSVGLIELAEDLDIETVTEIFIRVNSAGAELSQADFAMSKIAVNETYGGNTLRKAIVEGNASRFCAPANVHHRIPLSDHVRRETWLIPAPALDHRASVSIFGRMIKE